MKAVWTYQLKAGENILQIPGGASRSYLGFVAGTLYLWTQVNTDKPAQTVKVFIAATDEPLPEGCEEWLGTALTNGGAVAVHAFRME